MESSILTYMTFIPLLGAVIILCLPRDSNNLVRWVAVGATTPPLLMAIWLFANFNRSEAGFQYLQTGGINAYLYVVVIAVVGVMVAQLL